MPEIAYNEVWYDRGSKVVKTKRTSLIVDPPEGRLPAMTPTGQKQSGPLAAIAARDNQAGHPHADSWEDRPAAGALPFGFECRTTHDPGALQQQCPAVPGSRLRRALTEMVHDTRIVPLDGRPHADVRQWRGDFRGHWEGDTLVIETKNFKRETTLAGTSQSTHLVERFTRTDADTLLYEFTVDDPTTWTRPWTAAVPMRRPRSLSTNSPATRAITPWPAFSLVRGQTRKQRKKPGRRYRSEPPERGRISHKNARTEAPN